MLNSNSLSQFTGSEEYTQFGRFLLTQGARYVAEHGGRGEAGSAWWLMDLIASYLFVPRVRAEAFQVYNLTKNKSGSGAKVTVEDGNGNAVFTQRIPYTDFDFSGGETFTLWCIDGTILLPSEY